MRKSIVLAASIAASSVALAGSVTVQVVDKDGKPTPNAVVVVMPTQNGTTARIALPMQATVMQEKMQFIPSVSLVASGAKVKFVNNDPWDHHVRGSAAGAAQFVAGNGGGFDLRLEGKSEGKPAKAVEVAMDQPGAVGARLLGCFIHGSMRGFVYVSESPWAAKTAADGTATFDDVPDGAAQIKVWQADQLLDLPMQKILVGSTLAFTGVLKRCEPTTWMMSPAVMYSLASRTFA